MLRLPFTPCIESVLVTWILLLQVPWSLHDKRPEMVLYTFQLVKKKAHSRGHSSWCWDKLNCLCNYYKALPQHHGEYSSHYVTVWYASCTAENKRDFYCTMKAAQPVVRTELPNLDNVCASWPNKKASSSIKDTTHPEHCLVCSYSIWQVVQVDLDTHKLRYSFFLTTVASITSQPQPPKAAKGSRLQYASSDTLVREV